MNFPLRLSLHALDSCPTQLVEAAFHWLEPAQQARAERFATQQLRQRFLASQAALRRHLAERLQIEPAALTLLRETHGKPRLRDHGQLHFSLSHSAGWALVASAGVALGVDIEEEIAERRFDVAEGFLDAGALQVWRRLPAARRSAALSQAWCAREAVLKLDGRGLALDPRSLRMPAQLPGWAEWGGPLRRGHVQALAAPSGFHACLASAEALSAAPAPTARDW